MAKHQGTLGNYGLDPIDPMARFPVGFDISVSTYGSYWCFRSGFGAQFIYDMYEFLDRSAYEYEVFAGNAPDAFGVFEWFNAQTLYVWFIADGDCWVDYSLTGIAPYEIYKDTRQHLVMLSAYGFRVRSSVIGSNTPYQLVVWR